MFDCCALASESYNVDLTITIEIAVVGSGSWCPNLCFRVRVGASKAWLFGLFSTILMW